VSQKRDPIATIREIIWAVVALTFMGIKKSNVLIVGFILALTAVMGLWYSCSIDRCGF